MRAARLLHDLLDDACQCIDKRLRKTLFLTVETLTSCKKLTVVGLGRFLNQPAKVKHNIKRVDRLFGNDSLQAQRKVIYQAINYKLLKRSLRVKSGFWLKQPKATPLPTT